MKGLLACLFALLFLFCSVSCQDAVDTEDSVGNNGEVVVDIPEIEEVAEELIIGPHPSFRTRAIFPKAANQRELIGGDVAEILIGISNEDRELAFNVSVLAAALTSDDFKYFVQNFSAIPYLAVVRPGEQISLSYLFRPDALLEGRVYGLSGVIAYADQTGRNYTTSFFNQTVTLVEPDALVDSTTLLIWLIIVIAAALGGYFFLRNNKTRRVQARSAAFRAAADKPVERSEEEVNEWLEGTNARRNQPRRDQEPRATKDSSKRRR